MSKAKQARGAGEKAGLKSTRITKVAAELIARQGFGRTSFQQIADRLGVSQSAVMYHFKSKDELLAAIADEVVASNHEFVSALHRPEHAAVERLYHHFCGNLDWVEARPLYARLVLLIYFQASHDRQFKELYHRILKGARARVLEHVLAAQREGHTLTLGSVELTVKVLHDSLLGGVLNYICSDADQGYSTKSIKSQWKSYLKGLLPQGY